MLRIAVCDDEPLWLDMISMLLEEYFTAHQETPARIYPFTSASDLLEKAEEDGAFDLYLLDMMMPEMTGIDAGFRIREKDKRGLIVYLTVSPEFALNAYQVEAFNYLLKPVKREALFAVLEKAAAILSGRHSRAISVKTKDGVQRLLFDDVVYVEYAGRCCRYYLQDGSVVPANQQRASFADMMAPLLKDERFFRCGASLVLNLYYIRAVEKDAVRFSNRQTPLYLPKNAGAPLLGAWMDFWIDEKNG